MLSWLTKNTLDREVSMKIKDIGNVVTGKTPQTAHAEFYGGDYMFITPTELHGGYKISSSEKTLFKAHGNIAHIPTNAAY